MATNKYKELSNWLENYPSLNSWLYFNVTNYDAGVVSLNSVTMSRALFEDVLGNKKVEMVGAIDMIKDYDAGTSDVNLDAIQEVQNFASWIEKQNSKPNFGSNIIIEKIEVLNSAPSLSVDNEQNLAKYQFQIKITYLESEE